jgi:hypothetical protein
MAGFVKRAVYFLFICFLIYLIYEIIRKLLGGSLGFEELIIAFLVANLGYSFHLNNEMHRLSGNLKNDISKVDAKIGEHIGWHKGKESKEN